MTAGESSAQVVLSENPLEAAAGVRAGRLLRGHEVFPLVAVFIGGGAEPADSEFGGELVRLGVNPATDLRERSWSRLSLSKLGLRGLRD